VRGRNGAGLVKDRRSLVGDGCHCLMTRDVRALAVRLWRRRL
jgi:hypothetical protein